MLRIAIAAALTMLSAAAPAQAFDLAPYGAPIALPSAEDAARMERIRKTIEPDDSSYGVRINPGNYGHGIGQGRCLGHPAWRGCGAGDGR